MVAGMKNGEMRAGPFLEQNLVLPLDHLESADAAADVDADALGLFAVVTLKPDACNAKSARRDGELDEPAHLLDFFFLDVIRRVEVLHLAGDSASEVGGVEGGDGGDPARALLDGLPDCFRADTNRSQQDRHR